MVAQGAVGQRREAVYLAKPGATRNWSRVLLYYVMSIHGDQLQGEESLKLEIMCDRYENACVEVRVTMGHLA